VRLDTGLDRDWRLLALYETPASMRSRGLSHEPMIPAFPGKLTVLAGRKSHPPFLFVEVRHASGDRGDSNNAPSAQTTHASFSSK